MSAVGSVRRRFVLVAVPLALVAAGLIVETAGLFPSLRFAIQRSAHMAPSALALPAPERDRGVSTVSLFLRQRDLTARLRGLLTNPMRHGPEWERPGWVSFFEGGRVIHSAPVGVRIHGGSSREQKRPQGFRLYFRRALGARELPGRVAFGTAHAHPLRRLILHNDYRDRRDGTRWQLTNPLAFDIARAVGALAPPTRPVRFVLNGTFQGVYVLTEHLHPRDYFEAHPGYRMRATHEEINALWRQVRAIRPLRMQTVQPLVDTDNLTRWFIATVFSATGDAYQEPGVFRDPTRTSGQWFWVNWDMDASFRDAEQDSFPLLLSRTGERRARRANDPRPYLLSTLLDQDPEYRAHFQRVWTDVMNHALTPAFLAERYAHYETVATTLGIEDRRYLALLQRFLTNRPAAAWRSAEQWLGTGPGVPCVIAGTGGAIAIDGHRVFPGWQGRYFPGMPIRLGVPAGRESTFAHWRINGRMVSGHSVTVTAAEPLQVEAVWQHDGSVPALQPPPV